MLIYHAKTIIAILFAHKKRHSKTSCCDCYCLMNTALSREAFFYPWDTVPGAQWAFLNTVSGAEMTTLVLSATDPVRNALPPTTECSPITVSPPRMDAPE